MAEFFIFFFFFFSLWTLHFSLPCPVQHPWCDSSIDIYYPFYIDSPHPDCREGIYLIRCNDSSTPTIQFTDYVGRNVTYPVKNISYDDQIITIQDWQFDTVHLNDAHCSFFYNFSNPIPHYESPHPIAIDDLDTFISTCNWKKQDFPLLASNYNYSACEDFNLYYWSESQNGRLPQGVPTTCRARKAPLFEMKLSFAERPGGGLSLLSAGFSHYLELRPDCFNNSVCSEKDKHVKAIVGASVGGVAGLVLVCCVVFCCYKRKQRLQRPFVSNLLSWSTSSKISTKNDPELGETHYQTHIFSYDELQEATNGFSSELGDGGFGTVYKGKLRDGRTVAVKRLYEHNFRRLEQFMNEVDILSRLRHQHLVTLYGCTSRYSRELLLVYEFISNGTVADHLHGEYAIAKPLLWHVRMQIAIETADALAYLHAVEPQIIHRDVKSNNILLDDNFHVKVADFGLSRLFPLDATHVSTAPQGTPGYVDPEYHQCYQLTDKSDVYSFGVVLVELISSKPAVDISRTRHEINLANMAVTKIQKRQLDELVDPKLGYDTDMDVKRMITQVAELAFMCLQSDGDVRPTIKEVLESLKDIEGGNYDVENASTDVVQVQTHEEEKTRAVKKSPSLFSPDSVIVEGWESRETTPGNSG